MELELRAWSLDSCPDHSDLWCCSVQRSSWSHGEQGRQAVGGHKPVLLPVRTSMCLFRTRRDTAQALVTLLRSAQLPREQLWHCGQAKVRRDESYPRQKHKKKCYCYSGPRCWDVFCKSCGKHLLSLMFLLCWCLFCPWCQCGDGVLFAQRWAEVCVWLVLRSFHKRKYDLEKFMLEKLENRRGKWWSNQTSKTWTIWGFLVCNLKNQTIIQYIFSLKTSLELLLFELNCFP